MKVVPENQGTDPDRDLSQGRYFLSHCLQKHPLYYTYQPAKGSPFQRAYFINRKGE